MNLNENHFQIFGVPARFGMDLEALETRYHELQREVHPTGSPPRRRPSSASRCSSRRG